MFSSEPLYGILLFALKLLVDLLQNKLLNLTCETKLFGGFWDAARRKVKINSINHSVDGSFHMSND